MGASFPTRPCTRSWPFTSTFSTRTTTSKSSARRTPHQVRHPIWYLGAFCSKGINVAGLGMFHSFRCCQACTGRAGPLRGGPRLGARRPAPVPRPERAPVRQPQQFVRPCKDVSACACAAPDAVPSVLFLFPLYMWTQPSPLASGRGGGEGADAHRHRGGSQGRCARRLRCGGKDAHGHVDAHQVGVGCIDRCGRRASVPEKGRHVQLDLGGPRRADEAHIQCALVRPKRLGRLDGVVHTRRHWRLSHRLHQLAVPLGRVAPALLSQIPAPCPVSAGLR